MRLGIFADTHDHLDHLRAAVDLFNQVGCDAVFFAGDLVSTFAVPPLRKLQAPFFGCFGDNEGNKLGLLAGMSIVGTLGEPPYGVRLPDGTRVLLAHMRRQLRGWDQQFDLLIYAHTHRPCLQLDEQGRLTVNPGETSGWTYGEPTVAVVETQPLRGEIVSLRRA